MDLDSSHTKGLMVNISEFDFGTHQIIQVYFKMGIIGNQTVGFPVSIVFRVRFIGSFPIIGRHPYLNPKESQAC